jgi:hypothetical protein
MKPKPAFVGTDSVIVLNAPTAVNTNISFVVFPANPKDNNAIRFRHALHDLRLMIPGLIFDIRENTGGDLVNCLVKFGFARIAFLNAVLEAF